MERTSKVSMAFIKMDDRVPEHPKILDAGPFGQLLWTNSLCYANRNLTDGFIPASVARRLIDVEGYSLEGIPLTITAIIEALVKVGLWEKRDGGYLIRQYLDYQTSKAEIEAKRAVRAEAGRLGGISSVASKSEANSQANAQANSEQNSTKKKRSKESISEEEKARMEEDNHSPNLTEEAKEKTVRINDHLSASTQKASRSGTGKSKYSLPIGYSDRVWKLLIAQFGPLTWGSAGYPRETEALRTVVEAIPEVTPEEIVAFLAYKAHCDSMWKSDSAEMPLLSNTKKDFGRWYESGKPKSPNEGRSITNGHIDHQGRGTRNRRPYATKSQQFDESLEDQARLAEAIVGSEGYF